MKILIFGIDGLGEASLSGLNLRRLTQRLKKGKAASPAIQNVISRGWPELYTGKDAYETGGFYQVPEYRGGKILPTQDTGLSAIKKVIGTEDILWNRLNRLGYAVGVFTIPTVTQPEAVDGFCVAATGAGKFGNRLSDNDLYPEDLLDGLQVKDVDLGFRMGFGAYMPHSMEDLERHANKHIADFFYTLDRVLDRHPVDICFAASRFVNEMAYKFLGLCISKPQNAFESELKSLIFSLCDSFDARLHDFINRLDPQHVFLVSDHGIGPFEHELNLNQFLVETGMMKRHTVFTHWKEIARPVYLWGKKHVLRQRVGVNPPKYRLDEADIFSIGFTNVLYVNDQRFGGKCLPEKDRDMLVESTIDRLNAKARELGVDNLLQFETAGRHRRVAGDRQLSRHLPDIICRIAPGVANTERQLPILKKKEYGFDRMFSSGFYGEHSGCKTEDTIAAYWGPRENDVDLSSLTGVYHSILRIAKVSHDR